MNVPLADLSYSTNSTSTAGAVNGTGTMNVATNKVDKEEGGVVTDTTPLKKKQ